MSSPLQYLRAFLKEWRSDRQSRFKWVLPFGDYVSDRWEKARALDFGVRASTYNFIFAFGDVTVGVNTWIGPFTVLDGSGGRLQIGSNCSISAGVQIYIHETVNWAITGGQTPATHASTTIGDRCYLAPNVVVPKGVTLGNGCVVGAQSFVNKRFSPRLKIAGSPMQLLHDGALEGAMS